MTNIKLRLKESNSLLKAAKHAHQNTNLDLLYLISEKMDNIWESDFKEHHGKTWCQISNQPDVTKICENIEQIQTLTANVEAHLRFFGQFADFNKDTQQWECP
jgi:NADPH-dependent 7-cyano-7-deazaguanine reductase QueF